MIYPKKFTSLVAFLLITIVAISFLVYKKYAYIIKVPSDTIEKIIPVAKVSTEGWKTCRNEALGYEFKYPSNWRLYNNVDSEKVKVAGGYVTQGTSTDRCFGNVSVSSFIQTSSQNFTPPQEEEDNFFSIIINKTKEVANSEELAKQLLEEAEQNYYQINNTALNKNNDFNLTKEYILDTTLLAPVVRTYAYMWNPAWKIIYLRKDMKSFATIYIGANSFYGAPTILTNEITETILSTFKLIK